MLIQSHLKPVQVGIALYSIHWPVWWESIWLADLGRTYKYKTKYRIFLWNLIKLFIEPLFKIIGSSKQNPPAMFPLSTEQLHCAQLKHPLPKLNKVICKCNWQLLWDQLRHPSWKKAVCKKAKVICSWSTYYCPSWEKCRMNFISFNSYLS